MNGAKIDIWAMIVKRFFAFARQILEDRPGGGIFGRTANIRQTYQAGELAPIFFLIKPLYRHFTPVQICCRLKLVLGDQIANLTLDKLRCRDALVAPVELDGLILSKPIEASQPQEATFS